MTKKPNRYPFEALPGDVAETTRNLWLAGLGALVTVEEEGTKLYQSVLEQGSEQLDALQKEAANAFKDFVERGRKVEAKGRKQLTAQVDAVKEDLTERQKELTDTVGHAAEKLETRVTDTVEQTLARIDVPTRKEVRALTRKVERLTKNVSELAASLEQ